MVYRSFPIIITNTTLFFKIVFTCSVGKFFAFPFQVWDAVLAETAERPADEPHQGVTARVAGQAAAADAGARKGSGAV
jgi:hypothetical protein